LISVVLFYQLAIAEPSSRDLVDVAFDPKACKPILEKALKTIEAKNVEIKKLKLDIEELKLKIKH
jgi:hypothetical protein